MHRALALAAAAAVSASTAHGGSGLAAELVTGGLDKPCGITHAPGDHTRLFVLEKKGRVRQVNARTGELLPEDFLDLQGVVVTSNTQSDERGLIGIAFDPLYQTNGHFYVSYTNAGSHTAIERYTVPPGSSVADPASAHPILLFEQPTGIHNTHWMQFGPLDGFLYIAAGDGGGGGDPDGRAQDISQIFGKILRIDIRSDAFPADPDRNYAIPPDNPFVGVGAGEVFAYGLRNPWRNDFDDETGDLYLADVGQGGWEEVSFLGAGTSGLNFGWRCFEGNHRFPPFCDPPPDFVAPIHEFSHTTGCAIVGGAVYRGCAIPALDGHFLFADYCFGRIWSLLYDGRSVIAFEELTSQLNPGGDILFITSFGEDARGEVYFLKGSEDGEVWRIVPVKGAPSPADLDCSGSVDVDDLVLMLGAWGDNPGSIADIDGNGAVDVDDLVALLGEWTV